MSPVRVQLVDPSAFTPPYDHALAAALARAGADVELVTKEMSRCSDFLHDESGAIHAGAPEPDVVEADIARLDDWIKDLRKNRGRR